MNLDEFDLAENYRITRERLSMLVEGMKDASVVPVPSCPGWSVHDVVAHLTAVAEEVLEGKLTRPPSDEETAAQIARRRARPTSSVLADWAELAPRFEELLSRVRVWPAFLDVLAHEHDVMGSVGRRDGRDGTQVRAAAEWLLRTWEPPVRVLVLVGGAELVLGPAPAEGAEELHETPSKDPRWAHPTNPDQDHARLCCSGRRRSRHSGSASVVEVRLSSARWAGAAIRLRCSEA